MKTLNLSNRGITTPVIQERCYLIKIVKPSGEITILRNKDRFDALREAFTIAFRKPEYKVYFVSVKSFI